MIKKSRFVLALAATVSLAVSAIAFGDGTSENNAVVLGAVTQKKQDAKKYKPVDFFAGVETTVNGGVSGTQQNAATEVLLFGSNIKFDIDSTPVCAALPPSGSTPEQAKAACPQSFLGSGRAQVTRPGGALIDDIEVSLFHGGPGNAGQGPPKQNAIMLHTYSPTLGNAAPTVNGEIVPASQVARVVGRRAAGGYKDSLFVEHAPETGPLFINHFDSHVTKSSKAVTARCKPTKKHGKKGVFKFRRIVTYKDGTKDTADLSQKCKVKQKKGGN